MHENQVEALRSGLEDAIKSLPEGFYDTFNFTTTGKNLCHPVTLGMLAKVVGEMDGIGYIGIDVRLNAGNGLKFQPDIVGYRNAEGLQSGQAVIFVDFESPNSCDARITEYHLKQYLAWVKDPKHRAPYVIITSLPEGPAPWQLRYASELNVKHKGKLKLICENPLRYWTDVWNRELRQRTRFASVFFLNIDRRKVVPLTLPF